jgi:hypothetical protein
MPKRSSKSRDLNAMAAAIVDQATSDEPEPDPGEGKNPAAVELGRLGGKKGGRARAEKLTPKQRSEIARKAAQARWRGESRNKGTTRPTSE